MSESHGRVGPGIVHTSSSRYDIDVVGLAKAEDLLVEAVAVRHFLEDGRFADNRVGPDRHSQPTSTWNCIAASLFLADVLNYVDSDGRWQAHSGTAGRGSHGHAFVVGHDGCMAADVTADQFEDFPAVILKPLADTADYRMEVRDPIGSWWADLDPQTTQGRWLAEWRQAAAIYRADARCLLESFREEFCLAPVSSPPGP